MYLYYTSSLYRQKNVDVFNYIEDPATFVDTRYSKDILGNIVECKVLSREILVFSIGQTVTRFSQSKEEGFMLQLR